MASPPKWDIFCAVVDNYGDIGVCWRLARQLASEHGLQVRLWVDDLAPFARLRPISDIDTDIDTDSNSIRDLQLVDGVEVRHWATEFPDAEVADVVIEAFACELPANYLAAMAACSEPPVWINLEYLSAETWVEGTHRLASPHPRLPLTKYFFFPGFTAATGGLLREADYKESAARFDPAAFRAGLELPPQLDGELTLSLFGYENPALPGLFDAWANGPDRINCLLPEGRLLPQVQEYFGTSKALMQRGKLDLYVIPFLPQQDYDALLQLCDLNFVRGEDSFVRAQWAEKPFVWHIYPQTEGTHMVKLEAFLIRYLAGLPTPAADAVRRFWTAWNDAGNNAGAAGAAWPGFARSLPSLREYGKSWSGALAGHGDLATNLLDFVRQKARK